MPGPAHGRSILSGVHLGLDFVVAMAAVCDPSDSNQGSLGLRWRLIFLCLLNPWLKTSVWSVHLGEGLCTPAPPAV